MRFHHGESATAAAMSRPPPAANQETMSICLRTIVRAAGSLASSPVTFTPTWPGQARQGFEMSAAGSINGMDPPSDLEFTPGMAAHSLRELPVRWGES